MAPATWNSAVKDRLRAIIEQRSFRTGELFTLASGKQSRVFFDLKKTMLDPEGSYLAALGLLDTIQRDFSQASCFGGLELGAVPAVSQVCALSHVHGSPLPAFIVRKTVKDHGTQAAIEGDLPAGSKALVFDDVTTTGGSAMKAIEALKATSGVEVIGVVSLVDRQEGAFEAFQAQYGDAFGFQSLFEKSDFTDLI